MAYATVEDLRRRSRRAISADEEALYETALEDVAVLIDQVNEHASIEAKRIVSCKVVLRAISEDVDSGIPAGATQGSMSGMGYAQSWTISCGSVGEMYLTKVEKQMLGIKGKIGSVSLLEAAT
ncbi:MAG: hypothetical protein Q4B85_06650 [Lachnospiraceae bacterium]|nr:hypothetical protein [Lachnospiraceae bacterium]